MCICTRHTRAIADDKSITIVIRVTINKKDLRYKISLLIARSSCNAFDVEHVATVLSIAQEFI
jgi:hypothetical protein